MSEASDAALASIDILPVKCPQCGEAQNTLDGASDPLDEKARIGCMVCNYVFAADEYRALLDSRQREFQGLQIGEL